MITLSTSGNSVIFTFQDNQHYLQNGTIEVPKNSLLLVTDDSNMATFKKSASNDIFISALYSELGMSKSELEAWFEENATTNYGGGGGGGDITSGEVQTMIDESISGKADTSVVTAVNDVLTSHVGNTAIHVTVGDKLTWDGKQDALTAGTGIDITNDVISCTVTGGGNNVVELTQAQYDALVDKDPDAFYIITDAPAIDLSGYVNTSAITSAVTSASTDSQIPTAKAVYDAIPTGGTSITIDPSLDSGSTNPVANSAITIALNDKISKNVGLKNVIGSQAGGTSGYSQLNLVLTLGSGSVQQRLCTYISTINGNSLISDNKNNIKSFDLVETSAVTSSITSASTNSQIPTAKAVYDALGQGGGAASSAITSGDTNAVAGGAVYDKFDEVEQVTAAALNALNDNFGGLKLVKLTQQEYENLQVKDSSTLYIITNNL